MTRTYLRGGALGLMLAGCTPQVGLPRIAEQTSCAALELSLCEWASTYDGIVLATIESVDGLLTPIANDEGLLELDASCSQVVGAIGLRLKGVEPLYGSGDVSMIRLGQFAMTSLAPRPVVSANGEVQWVGEGNRLGTGLRMILPFVALRDVGVELTELPLFAAPDDGTIEVQATDCPPAFLQDVADVDDLRAKLEACPLDGGVSPLHAQAVDNAIAFPMQQYAAACADAPGTSEE